MGFLVWMIIFFVKTLTFQLLLLVFLEILLNLENKSITQTCGKLQCLFSRYTTQYTHNRGYGMQILYSSCMFNKNHKIYEINNYYVIIYKLKNVDTMWKKNLKTCYLSHLNYININYLKFFQLKYLIAKVGSYVSKFIRN